MAFFNKANQSPFSYQLFLLPYIFNFIGLFLVLAACFTAYEARFGDIAILKANLLPLQFHLKNIIVAGLGMMLFARAKIEDGREGEFRSIAFGFLILYELGMIGLKKEVDYFFEKSVTVMDAQVMTVAGMVIALLTIYGFKLYHFLYEKFSKGGKSKKGD